MCGICGILTTEAPGKDRRADIASMMGTLRHRGPDGEGIFSGEGATLGVRRLKIIDLEGGDQPIHNEDKTLWIVFNGMIYNFLDLRRELESRGHKFYTRTDTEVIVHLYEEYGEDCVLRLNGMFAFAIWQVKGRKLFLARDRLGVKPLYYAESAGSFIFASEIKAIMKFPGVKKEVDPFSLAQYLTFDYVPAPDSIYKNIRKLLPGHALTYSGGHAVIREYWDIANERSEKELNINEALSRLSELFKDAVKIRLISDVPKGVFLSGGLDSGLVTAIACSSGEEKIKTFSIGFTEPSFDESAFSRSLASHFNTEHHERMFTAKDLADILPQLAEFLDEPYADASILPTYLLSRFAKEQITVALSGDGGDEVFAGYSTYMAHKLAAYCRFFPAALNRAMYAAAKFALPVSMKYMSFDFRFKRFFSALNKEPYIRHHLWLGPFSAEEKENLLLPGIAGRLNDEKIFAASADYFKKFNSRGILDKMQFLDIKTYLPGVGLARLDAAGMANSLEVRSPFLDHRLVEFALGLPQEFRLNNFTTKYILKKFAGQVLPDKVIRRHKRGFGIPVSFWIRNELKDLVLEVLSEKRIKESGIFQYACVNRILKDHFANKANNHRQIWSLLMLELWLKKTRAG